MTADPVRLPAMSGGQELSWRTLFDVADRLPRHWALVGGQMVHLLCAERGAAPERPTDDVDTVVDLRADPHMLETFTGTLLDLGLRPETSGEGVQHRWSKGTGDGRAQIDVLLPEGIGERAAGAHGVGGASTITTSGGTQALARTEWVHVQLGPRVGSVPRPSLPGALVIKAAAHGADTTRRARHRQDFVTLAGLLTARDARSVSWSAKDRRRLRLMISAVRLDVDLVLAGAEVTPDRLERALEL